MPTQNEKKWYWLCHICISPYEPQKEGAHDDCFKKFQRQQTTAEAAAENGNGLRVLPTSGTRARNQRPSR